MIVGRASEYFDFFVYAIASVLVFPSVFFPFEGRLEGTLYSFVVFSFAFVARPLGSVLFMAIQRHMGRFHEGFCVRSRRLRCAAGWAYLSSDGYGTARGFAGDELMAPPRRSAAVLARDLLDLNDPGSVADWLIAQEQRFEYDPRTYAA